MAVGSNVTASSQELSHATNAPRSCAASLLETWETKWGQDRFRRREAEIAGVEIALGERFVFLCTNNRRQPVAPDKRGPLNQAAFFVVFQQPSGVSGAAVAASERQKEAPPDLLSWRLTLLVT